MLRVLLDGRRCEEIDESELEEDLVVMELEEALGKLTDRMQIKREHGVSLLQSVLTNAGTSTHQRFSLFLFHFVFGIILVIFTASLTIFEYNISHVPKLSDPAFVVHSHSALQIMHILCILELRVWCKS